MRPQLDLFADRADQLRKPIGNTKLVEYGIQNDKSDYHAHVGCIVRKAFVFKTAEAHGLILSNRYALKSVSLDGAIVTARGYAVPLSHLKIQSVIIPPSIWDRNTICKTDSTDVKGLRAVAMVRWLLTNGRIALPLQSDIINDISLQIDGHDIVISNTLRMQIKCDFVAGEKTDGGSGNIFIQTMECNPYRFTGQERKPWEKGISL